MRLLPVMSMFALASAYLLAAPHPVQACSAPLCTAGSIVPSGGNVPQNSVVFVWRPPTGQDAGVANAARLYRGLADGGVGEALAFDSVGQAGAQIRPRATLNPRDTVILEYDDPCLRTGERVVRSTVQVTESAPVPTTLGTLRKSETKRGPLDLEVFSGECTKGVDSSYVELEIELASAARPYADLFQYSLRVDGATARSYAASRSDWAKRYAYAAPQPLARGRDVLYALCDPRFGANPGSSEGVHRVQMAASLPDGTTLASDEAMVELRCDPSAGDGGLANDAGSFDAAVGSADAALRPVDASLGPADAAVGRVDAALTPDAGPAASMPSSSDEESSDGCSLARSGDGGSGPLALALLALALGRTRKLRA